MNGEVWGNELFGTNNSNNQCCYSSCNFVLYPCRVQGVVVLGTFSSLTCKMTALLRFPIFGRLFTVLYFSVRSSRSSALCYGFPSCMSVKTTQGAGAVWEEARKIEGQDQGLILRVFAQDVPYGMKANVLWKRRLVNDLSVSATQIKPVVNANQHLLSNDQSNACVAGTTRSVNASCRVA